MCDYLDMFSRIQSFTYRVAPCYYLASTFPFQCIVGVAPCKAYEGVPLLWREIACSFCSRAVTKSFDIE